jgi:hypothetical protein
MSLLNHGGVFRDVEIGFIQECHLGRSKHAGFSGAPDYGERVFYCDGNVIKGIPQTL